MSAPKAASYTLSNPNAFMPVTSCPKLAGLNCDAIAGAIIANTLPPFSLASLSKSNVSMIKDLSTIAPKGQLYTQAPHAIHLSLSIFALSYSSIERALTLQLLIHGRDCSIIASYGHALAHLPHLIHFAISITGLLSTIVIASFGHAS